MLKKTLRLGARATALGTIAISLAGCGLFDSEDLRSMLGADKQAPDEFAVVTKAPLAIPPDFALRPPQPGAPRPQEANAQPGEAARAALVGEDEEQTAAVPAGSSAGQEQLLSMTGGKRADPNVRAVINQETRGLVEKDRGFTDDLLFWQSNTPPEEPQVDPVAERKRIEGAAASGQPVTEAQPSASEPAPAATQAAPEPAPEPESKPAEKKGGWFDFF